jgi:predicted ATP-grasp superfamily ATP-dependent carboligase
MNALHPEMSADRAATPPPLDTSTPVILLGGGVNGVAVARNLGRLGVRVTAAGGPGAWATASKACAQTLRQPSGVPLDAFWSELLLSDDRSRDGHVVLPLCDDSIDFVCRNRDALAGRYLLEAFDPEARLAMLDKRETLVRARAAGVPTPRFWSMDKLEDLDRVAGELVFPLMVKPIHSHLFVPVFGRKLFIVETSIAEVREKLALAFEKGIEVMLVEMIPGGDDLLSSYYTYVDEAGARLFDYTKCVIRRFPVNRGGGCYHRSAVLPETAEMGRRFFDGLGWRGMGNVEFKRDPRDGQLKVIECNPRFTAAHPLVLAAGVPMDEAVYRSVTGQPPIPARQRDEDLRMIDLSRDIFAGLELRRRGELTVGGWLRSVRQGRKVYSLLSLSDPGPSLTRSGQVVGRALRRLLPV